MDNATLLIQRITDAQHNASVSVILPLLMSGKRNYEAAQEWKAFAALSVLYTQASSPKTPFDYPLQFLEWLIAHPNMPGAKDYIDHLATEATAINTAIAHGVNNTPLVSAGLNAMAQHNFTTII